MVLQNPLLPVNNPSTDTLPAPAADNLTGADIQRLRHSMNQSNSENTRAMYEKIGKLPKERATDGPNYLDDSRFN